MSLIQRYLLLAALLIAVVIGGVFWFQGSSSQKNPPSAEATQENHEQQQLPDFTASADDELFFSQSLLVLARSISVDGGPLQKIPCHEKQQEPHPRFAYISEGDESLDIICVIDYMGGVSLRYREKSGKLVLLNLARTEGDAGDLWDTRTLITKAPDGSLLINTVTLTSSQDLTEAEQPDDIPPPLCEEDLITLTWDPEQQTFIETLAADQFSASQFMPPIEVDEGCLDENGRWNPLR